jgi:hypothetical protein
MMEALRSSETSVLTRAAQHNIPEDGIVYEDTCIKEVIFQNGLDLRMHYES